MQVDFEHADVAWFVGAKLNAHYNCVDRHLPKYADKIALRWEGNKASEQKNLTYAEPLSEVTRFLNNDFTDYGFNGSLLTTSKVKLRMP